MHLSGELTAEYMMNLRGRPCSTASEKFLRMALSRIPGKLTTAQINSRILFDFVGLLFLSAVSFALLASTCWCSSGERTAPGLHLIFSNESSLMWNLTSRELGLLFSLVTEDAVCDLKGCDSPQGVQDVMGSPARESQVMDPLCKEWNKKPSITILVITEENPQTEVNKV